MENNTTRFTGRVQDYIKYRPHYPDDIIGVLEKKIGFNNTWVIADIGSGTGISSEPFLKNGNTVFGVEPNKEMREAAESIFAGNPKFISIDGTAEHSNLKEHSIDLIVCGQAFHWFDRTKAKTEFERIQKSTGHIALIWNERNEKTELLKRYEQMLMKNIPEYKHVTHRNISDHDISHFFQPRNSFVESFANFQTFDLNSLKGRLKSSSYCPKEGIIYDKLMSEIDILFYEFEQNGKVNFEYETKMYYC